MEGNSNSNVIFDQPYTTIGQKKRKCNRKSQLILRLLEFIFSSKEAMPQVSRWMVPLGYHSEKN